MNVSVSLTDPSVDVVLAIPVPLVSRGTVVPSEAIDGADPVPAAGPQSGVPSASLQK